MISQLPHYLTRELIPQTFSGLFKLLGEAAELSVIKDTINNLIDWVEANTPGISQLEWYVNTNTGSDRGSGSASSPLKSLDELSKRLRGGIFKQNAKIYINGAFPGDFLVTFGTSDGAKVALVGTKTLIHSGSFTGVVAENAAAAQPWELTDAALPVGWTASGCVDATAAVGSYLIRKVDAGGATIASAFTAYAVAKVLRTSAWVNTNDDPFTIDTLVEYNALAPGDLYEVDSLTTIGDIVCLVPGTEIITQWVAIRAISGTAKFSIAGSGRITWRMTSIDGDSLPEGNSSYRGFTCCFQQGCSGMVCVGEWDGFGFLLRGRSAASTTFRIFGSSGWVFPGTLMLQSCGVYCDNGTALGFTNVLACNLTAGVPAVEVNTNSKIKFNTVAGVNCVDVGVQVDSGSLAVLSSGIVGAFTAGASRIAGAIIPNAKLGVASYDYRHQCGVVTDETIGSPSVGPNGSSTTAARPTVGLSAGMLWFDTDLNAGAGKPIWRNSTNTGWIDAAGGAV